MVGERKGPESGGGTILYVWVKDREGNEFLCPLDALIDPRKATDEQLNNAIDHGDAALDRGDSPSRSGGNR